MGFCVLREKLYLAWNVHRLKRLPFIGYIFAWVFISSIMFSVCSGNFDENSDNSFLSSLFLLSTDEVYIEYLFCTILGILVSSLLVSQRLRDIGIKMAKTTGILFIIIAYMNYYTFISFDFKLISLNLAFIFIGYIILIFVPSKN